MHAQSVVPGLYRLPIRYVANVYLLEDGDRLALIDTGMPWTVGRILGAVRALGFEPQAIGAILVTHLHPDHTGGLRALRERTGATVYAHPIDARAIREGRSLRSIGPEGSPLGRLLGFANRILPLAIVPAAEVDVEVEDGDVIDVAGGLRVVHAPGHSAGQIALLWSAHGGVLIAGDAATNRRDRLGTPPFYENTRDGRATLRRLASLDVEVAVFGHGQPIRAGAAERFRRAFG